MADYAPVNLTAEGQVEFELNGRRVTAPAGTMLVDAAYAHGVEVPIFCYEPRLGAPIGACRMCLVEVEGMRGLQTACSTPVQPDMVVRTNSEVAVDGQDGVLEFLLENHPLDCPVCDKGGECPLQDRTFRFGPGRTRFVEPKRHFPKPLDLSSLIALDRERCIHCFRCVRFSQDVAEDKALVMENRGAGQEIGTITGDQYEGRFTGNVIDLCPVGALTSIPYRFVARPWDITNTPSVCGHDATGTNVELTGREGRIARVTGRPVPNYDVEEGWLSDLSRFAYTGNDGARPPAPGRHPRRRPRPRREPGGGGRRRRRWCCATAGARASCSARPRRWRRASWPRSSPRRRCPARSSPRLGIPGDGLEALRSLPTADLSAIDAADLVVIVGGDPANQQAIVELRVRKARRARRPRSSPSGPGRTRWSRLGTAVRSLPGELAARAARPGPRRAPSAPWCCGTRPTWPPSRTPPAALARARRRPRRAPDRAGRRRQRRGPARARHPGHRAARGRPGGRDRRAAHDQGRPARRARAPPTGAGRSAACAGASPSRATPPR